MSKTRPRIGAWVHPFALATACATLVLIVAGGLVTSTGAGLAVPDWPLSYGQLMPRMVGGVLYEHGHRMIAGVVALMTLALALLLQLSGARRGLRLLGWTAVLTVLAQALLGGLTVLLKLPPAVSVAHAAMAQTFFCLVVLLALATGRGWSSPTLEPASSGLRRLALLTLLAIYAQLLLGAAMRHTDAGLAIPDFPLAFGRLIPPLDDTGVALHFAHRVGAVVVLALVWTLAYRVQTGGAPARMLRPARLAAVLVFVQAALGASTVLLRKHVVPTTAHVATGAVLLACVVVLGVQAWRRAGGHAETELVPRAEAA